MRTFVCDLVDCGRIPEMDGQIKRFYNEKRVVLDCFSGPALGGARWFFFSSKIFRCVRIFFLTIFLYR